MKNLLYKEFKLAMHPLCYIFTFAFPILIIIPNYPSFLSTFFVTTAFSMLFLGATKGKQTNDLFYTALLPVRKKDIVKARMISLMLIEVVTLILVGVFSPLKTLIVDAINKGLPIGQQVAKIDFGSQGIISMFAFAIIGYTLVNAVFLLMFYRKGRSILAPSLIAPLGYLLFMMIFTMVLPDAIKSYSDFFVEVNIGYQFLYLIIALLLSSVLHILIYKKATNLIEKIDL